MLYYDVFGIKAGGGANRSGLLVCSGSGQCFLECSPAASKFLASMVLDNVESYLVMILHVTVLL